MPGKQFLHFRNGNKILITMITCAQKVHDFKTKTIFLGPLKSSKNMPRKSILIGLFVLNSNRTIGGPKYLQGG